MGGRRIDIERRDQQIGEDFFFIVKGKERVFKGRGRKHGKDQWENLGIQKPVEIFSPEGSVSRYVYCRPLLDSDYPFDV